ncbi:MAG TPA: hypothetical protein GX707_16520 [Epulopiscium sp.]|nr:hypothetical protein [Candidatus Epulonipiscium sp.]
MRYIVCLLLILTLSTGCSNNLNDIHGSINIPDHLKHVSFDEHLTISVGYWNIDNMVNAQEKDELLNYIEELFNITINPVLVDWSNYKERYRILSATNNLPDIHANLTISSTDSNDSSLLHRLIDNKQIRSIPNDLSKFPNLSKEIKSLEPLLNIEDSIYTIPRISFHDPILGSSDASMLIRKDWMENLNLKAPANLDEFINLVTAFANNDPNNSGEDDTLGYNVNSRIALGKWLLLGVAPECNVFSWIEKDGKYIPTYITENFKSVVSTFHNLYQKGGLDPDFYIKKSNDAVDDFIHGKLGALEYKSTPSNIMDIEERWNACQDKAFDESVTLLNIFPAPDGNLYSNSSNLFWSETLISSSVDEEKMERILYLFDYLLSDEGWALTHYGMEGIDYDYKDGEYRSLLNLGDSTLVAVLEDKYPSLILLSTLASWGGSWNDFELSEINYLRYGKNSLELSNGSLLWNKENTLQISRPYHFLLMPKESTELFNAESVLDDLTRIIISKKDPIKSWEAQLQFYYDNGLDEYINRQNELYKNYK